MTKQVVPERISIWRQSRKTGEWRCVAQAPYETRDQFMASYRARHPSAHIVASFSKPRQL